MDSLSGVGPGQEECLDFYLSVSNGSASRLNESEYYAIFAHRQVRGRQGNPRSVRWLGRRSGRRRGTAGAGCDDERQSQSEREQERARVNWLGHVLMIAEAARLEYAAGVQSQEELAGCVVMGGVALYLLSYGVYVLEAALDGVDREYRA